MRLGKFIINILYRNSYKSTLKRRPHYPPHGEFKELINIPYIEGDDNPLHSFDVYQANENRNNICFIDIHGGSYIFGEHKDNYPFCYYFVKRGFDAVNVDYIVNDGKTRSVYDTIDDIVKCLNYVFSHLKELGLENDKFVLTGDSAGGHFALLMAELLSDEEYAAKLGYKFPKIPLLAVAVNCPVYDFAHIKDGWLANSGAKRMFGPRHKEENYFLNLCPKAHIDSLRCPIFTSTCTKDFLRSHSLLLQEDMKTRSNKFGICDIASKRKGIGHVHNVLHPEYEESIIVNDAMIDFVLDCEQK